MQTSPDKNQNVPITFQEDSLLFISTAGREISFRYSDPLKVFYSWRAGSIQLQSGGDKFDFSVIPETSRGALFLDFFSRWHKKSPEAAKKAAFDYIDAQKSFLPVVFFGSLLFFTPMTIALFADSANQWQCTQKLARGTTPGEFTVTRMKKMRKGQYLLTLETEILGKRVAGNDQWIGEEEREIPKSMPAIFSTEDPHCWSLPYEKTGEMKPNWAKRRYFTTLSFLYGFSMLFVTIVGFLWSWSLYKKKQPYLAELKAQFQL